MRPASSAEGLDPYGVGVHIRINPFVSHPHVYFVGLVEVPVLDQNVHDSVVGMNGWVAVVEVHALEHVDSFLNLPSPTVAPHGFDVYSLQQGVIDVGSRLRKHVLHLLELAVKPELQDHAFVGEQRVLEPVFVFRRVEHLERLEGVPLGFHNSSDVFGKQSTTHFKNYRRRRRRRTEEEGLVSEKLWSVLFLPGSSSSSSVLMPRHHKMEPTWLDVDRTCLNDWRPAKYRIMSIWVASERNRRSERGEMESAGQWLEKALVELCSKIETGLGLGLDEEIIKGLVSYCDLAEPRDAKEYLDNIIGQEAGKTVIEEYLRRRGHSEFTANSDVPTTKLHAYVKPPSVETSTSGTKKSSRAPKSVTVHSYQAEPNKNAVTSNQENQIPTLGSESRTSQKGNQGNSRKKKAGKAVSLAEAAKGSIVFQQGRPCSCQARRHRLVSNCLSCGKIVCEQEGEGPCNFCGALVLREGSSYAGLEESLPPLSDAEAAAEAYAKRLVEYDRNSAARTTVIDDQSDYYEIDGNSWLSKEEKELLKKKQEEMEEVERAKRNKVVVTFDLVGRKVLLNEDEVSELQSDNRILRPQDEREVNRIKPNPTLRIQPVFVDLGFSKKSTTDRQSNKGLSNALCLEITGRVQHDSNDLKYFMMENQLATASNENFWQVPSGNGGMHREDDGECILNSE